MQTAYHCKYTYTHTLPHLLTHLTDIKILFSKFYCSRLEPRGKSLKDTDTVKSLNLGNGDKVYLRDLGPQIGWKTVFLAEYAGPLIVYLLFYFRPELVYGKAASKTISLTTQ